MNDENYKDLLERTGSIAGEFLRGLSERPVGRPVDFESLLEGFGDELPDEGEDSLRVIEELWRLADPGLVATAGPRYFGFVVGGALPASVAADWLTTLWDQNAGLYVLSPAAAAAEQVAARWLLDLFGLPKESGVGFVTGGTMANFTALAAARHSLPWQGRGGGGGGGLGGRAAARRGHERRVARLSLRVAANAGSRSRASRQSPDGRTGTHESGRTACDARGHSDSRDGLRAGGECEHGRGRSDS